MATVIKPTSQVIHERLRSLRGGRDEELIQQHAKAGVSMYGEDTFYPGEIIELAPDGKKYIIRVEDNKPVRVREVSAGSILSNS